MDSVADSKWRRVLDALGTAGWSLDTGLTPEQIGLLVQEKARDERVYRFVRGYYYPKSYGAVTPSVSEGEAEELVRGLSERPPRAPGRGSLRILPDTACSVCGKEVDPNERRRI